MPSNYKLIYFNFRGRAEVSRLMLAAAGVKYEDKRIDFSEWPELKQKIPEGTLPVLVIDDKVKVGQSMAIARYIAREFKFNGKTPLEMLYVDRFVDTALDLSGKFQGVLFPPADWDDAKKAEAMATLQNETVPKFLAMFEKFAEMCGTPGFAVGNSYTMADFQLFSVVEFARCAPETVEKFPKVAAILKKVKAHPRVAKYLENRPVTEN